MRRLELEGQIGPDHKLLCDVPADVPEGRAKVIVVLEEDPRPSGASWGQFIDQVEPDPHRPCASLQDFMRQVDDDPIEVLSKEEIDAYIEAERASWE